MEEQTVSNSDRINFRLNSQVKETIERAAAVQGQTLTQFATLTLKREADEILKSNHVLVLSDQDRDAFLSALDNPPRPSASLIRAAKEYAKAKHNGEIVST